METVGKNPSGLEKHDNVLFCLGLQALPEDGSLHKLSIASVRRTISACGGDLRMKTLKVQTLRGPNYWSSQHPKLVVFLLDLEDLVDKPLQQLPGFLERLTMLLPSLGQPDSDSHRCIQYLSQQGMTIAHGVERIALVLQQLAGMAVGFGHTQAIQVPGVYQVVVEYLNEAAGRYAARAAVRLCQSIVDTGSYPRWELEQDLRDLRELWAEASLGPSTETLVAAAEARGIPWLALSARSMIQLGYGKYQKRIQATLSDRTGILGVELASDKESTKKILQAAGIPVPQGTVIYYLDELPEAVAAIGGFPIVIKPLNGNHGRGITLNIDSWDLAEAAYNSAKDISRGVIVEHYYPGCDHRVLVVNGKVVAVAERVPAHVVGDGKSTIKELIESTNQDPQRGEGHEKVLTRIEIDYTTRKSLAREGYTLETVLPPGKVCYLRATANLSTGGTAIDRTEDIHPENIWLAERAAQIIGLDIAGIDMVTADISRPLREVNGAVVEVNAAPGLRMHSCPSQGTPRNVAEPILDMLFPPGTPSQIPIIAVAGSQGKTITTQLIAQIFKQTQQTVGYTTSTGTYINDFTVDHTLGRQNTQVILQDPTVEVVVLETAAREILQSGLSFAACDVSVVLNIASDPGGAGEMTAMEVRLNSVVASSAVPSGYVVLNADEPQIAAMGKRARAQVAYFTLNPGNPLVQAHIQEGGLAAIYENGYLAILKGDWQLQIERAANIPLTRGRQPSCMLGNPLAASLTPFVQGVRVEEIRAGLTSLSPAAESQLTPTTQRTMLHQHPIPLT